MRAARAKARRGRAALLTLAVFVGLSAGGLSLGAAPAQAVNPLFEYVPVPPPIGIGSPPPIPPPNNYFNGPCGVAVESSIDTDPMADPGGRFYLADHYHDAIDVFSAPSRAGYLTQLVKASTVRGPCAVAVDGAGNIYAADYHGALTKHVPTAYPPRGTTRYGAGTTIDAGPVTGVAFDSSTDDLYVASRGKVTRREPNGMPIGEIGVGSLGDASGVAVSDFPGTPELASTDGDVYVPDASTNTVKVFDPAVDPNAVASTLAPPGGFVSLREASIAIDDVSGDVYVVDNTQPALTEQPRGRVHVFSAAGTYKGHLRYDIVHGGPTGIAVDNSGHLRHPAGTQGRVYVTSGNTHEGGLYIYPPNAAVRGEPLAPTIPAKPLGALLLFPDTDIGDPSTQGGEIACEGDACQILPPEPTDPTLTTRLRGLGNPAVRYRDLIRCSRAAKKRGRGARRPKRCKRARRSRSARASASNSAPLRLIPGSQAKVAAEGGEGSSATATSALGGPGTLGLLPGAAGFDATLWADGGAPATLAGSHPYQLDFTLGLDPGEDLRNLSIDLPVGLLANPASTRLCPPSTFATPRSSPFGDVTESGESCADRTQLGTVEVRTGLGGGQTRRFGLFNLRPPIGSAARFAAAPFGEDLLIDAQIRSDSSGTYLRLVASEVPQALRLQGLQISLWGTPFDASHDTQRGNCLKETEPAFAWSKCSVGEPLSNRPVPLLTLPTLCGDALSFSATATSWQAAPESGGAISGGPTARVSGCETLGFNPTPEGLLSVEKASSATGYVFRLRNDDPALIDPRSRIRAHTRRAVVALPKGVTLNPSLGAGLVGCTPAQLANESAFNPFGAGCPNGSKIGTFQVSVPFYTGQLKGGIYLAQPNHPATGASGAENPFDSLLAVYLIAKSGDRGIILRFPGNLARDPGDGTITATFDGLPQIPYTDLEINFRSGQRAPLVSPPACGAAPTQITLTPWAQGAPTDTATTNSQILTGVDFGPCPAGTPPFAPGAVAGGVNSNVGSYTPYFIHLSRKDTEQEITSYSLVLPKGITGKLAGVPFCPDAAIEAARHKLGADEIANPSCPSASQVGRTDTGYGVGPALTYAPGRVYLAGPYGGSPLSLVTINAATVGPFDLGTIVIRSAFDVDEHTAQLQIDSSVSDPIPHIIDGVPLHLRDVRIHMDRFQFTHNPSSCEPSALVSTLTGSGVTFSNPADDSRVSISDHFQLLNCLNLGFRPRLGLRLRGGSRRGAYPSLRANFVSRGAQDSNLKKIQVEMPHSLFLAQNHIRTVCTRPQFATGRCPEGSIYGAAEAHTLLFDTPLRGNVYLRSSQGKLPDLVADLRSGSIRIIVEGRIGPGKQGGILTFFDNLPDAPIDRFTMVLHGGRRGLLQNSSNICKNPPLATVSALGQNNIGVRMTSTLRGQCKRGGGRR